MKRRLKPEKLKRKYYVAVKLTPEEKKKLKEIAYSKGLDMSEYIRQKIFEGVYK